MSNQAVPVEVVATASEYTPKTTTVSHPGHAYSDCSGTTSYFGRFDIRYDNEEDLRAGRNFKIVELNGASSEATNVYDARNSLRSAYDTLFRQWRLVFEIGAANRERGWTSSPLRTLWRAWRTYCAAAATYPCAS